MHPTGLVKPDDADAKIKFLAAEASGVFFFFSPSFVFVCFLLCLDFFNFQMKVLLLVVFLLREAVPMGGVHIPAF